MRASALVLLAVFVFAHPGSALADTPIGAKAVYVEGVSHVISVKDGKRRRVKVNTPFQEGDRLTTSQNGVVEIRFDTGNLIRVDKGADMVIRSLHRNDRGSTFSVFGLLVGRVKSAVSKLISSESKFEYHTRTAICGVAGTPPFIVAFQGNKTFVDLLGKKGEEGALRIQGLDPAKSIVTVLSGFRTVINPSQPPEIPRPITPQRFRQLNRAMPFKAEIKRLEKEPAEKKEPEKKEEEEKPAEKKKDEPEPGDKKKKEEPQAKAEPGKKEPAAPQPPAQPKPGPGSLTPGESLVVNTLARKVSKQLVVTSEEAQSVEGIEQQSSAEQGTAGQVTEGGKETIVPKTVTVDIQVDLR